MKQFIFPVLVLAFFICSCGNKPVADRIYINAMIWTGDSTQPADSRYDNKMAIAVKDSQILYVGTDYASLQGSNTEMIDLQGQMVVPGLVDNHTHFLSGGYQLTNVNLRTAQTRADFIQTLSAFSGTLPAGRWIVGGDWDHEAWGGELPDKKWIDSITGDNPVLVNRYDGHMALANSASLKLAGIDKFTKDPPGGTIVKDPVTGEPTGMLKDDAMSLVSRVIPAMTNEALDEAMQRGMQEAFAHGVTAVHDMGSYGGWTDLATYRRAHEKGTQALRIYSFVPLGDWQRLDSFIRKNGRGDDMLHWGGLKGFTDGSLGSTTAWFYEPYLDEPQTSGLILTDSALLRSWILGADAAGLQVAVHAIGDRANHCVLDIYEDAVKTNKGNSRLRIEHAQHLLQSDIARFSQLGVIPSMQPYHAIDDGRWAARRLDDRRLKTTYAFKSLLDHNARLTFGSDWTVAPLDPLAGIYAAVTRRTLDDANPGGWYPEQKVSVEQALISYTRNNAYAGFMENKTGILKAGYLADFAVLSQNLFKIAPENIRDVRVMRTVINGREVYKAGK